eukprot:412584-Rhodomonas_salina.2
MIGGCSIRDTVCAARMRTGSLTHTDTLTRSGAHVDLSQLASPHLLLLGPLSLLAPSASPPQNTLSAHHFTVSGRLPARRWQHPASPHLPFQATVTSGRGRNLPGLPTTRLINHHDVFSS